MDVNRRSSQKKILYCVFAIHVVQTVLDSSTMTSARPRCLSVTRSDLERVCPFSIEGQPPLGRHYGQDSTVPIYLSG